MAELRLTTLTDAQLARLPIIRDKWISIGLSTEPADRLRAERAVRRAYVRGGQAEPDKIIWLGSPMAGAIGSAFLKKLQDASVRGERRGERL